MHRFVRRRTALFFAPIAAAVVGLSAPASPIQAAGSCLGAIQHPIEVRVQPLDPVRRGAPIRVRVTASSRVPLDRTVIRLVSAGGAQAGPVARVALGRLTPERVASVDFELRLPERGHRFYVQFQVEGEGPNGLWRRGAAYNFLPDGAADPGRRVTASDGTAVHEYAARRVEP